MAMDFDSVIDVLEQEYKRNRGDFAPDVKAWQDVMKADVGQIMSSLPMSMEAFNADLASRGIYGSGEAPKHMYQDVVAPVARAATGATARFNLGLEESRQRGVVAEAQIRQQGLRDLLNAIISKEEYTTSWTELLFSLGGNILGEGAGRGTDKAFTAMGM